MIFRIVTVITLLFTHNKARFQLSLDQGPTSLIYVASILLLISVKPSFNGHVVLEVNRYGPSLRREKYDEGIRICLRTAL